MKNEQKNRVTIYCTGCRRIPVCYKSVQGVIVIYDETCGLVITDQNGTERFVNEFLLQYHIEVAEPEKTRLPLTPESIYTAIQECRRDSVNG